MWIVFIIIVIIDMCPEKIVKTKKTLDYHVQNEICLLMIRLLEWLMEHYKCILWVGDLDISKAFPGNVIFVRRGVEWL